MYNTTIDADLIREIKILAARLDKRQNDILEEAIQDLLDKYKSGDDETAALGVSNGWFASKECPAFIGERNLNNLAYIGFGLLGFGLVFFLYLVFSGKPEQDDEVEIDWSKPRAAQRRGYLGNPRPQPQTKPLLKLDNPFSQMRSGVF